jgi:hypothetical protein
LESRLLFAKHKEDKEHKALKSGGDAKKISKQCAEVSHKPKHPGQTKQKEEQNTGCNTLHHQLPPSLPVAFYGTTPHYTM